MASTSKIVIQVDANTVNAIKNVKGFEKAATSGFKKTENSLISVKNALIGLGAIKIGQTIVSGLTAATKAASDFSLAVAEIETILPKGQKSTGELKDELRALQRQFGGKATKQAKAYYQTISAGITDAAKAANVLEVANKLAIGGIGELEPTIDVLTSIINTYGDENLSAAEASDLLFTTVKNGKTTLSELSQFIGKALPNSKRLGVSFSELTASIATLTSRGLDTAKASTQLTRFFGAIANGQDRAAKLGPEVAKAFDIQALKAKGLTKFLQDLKVAINGDEAALQELLGSNEAASAFTVLTAQNFEKLTASLKDNANAAGATEEAYQRIFREFSTQAGIFSALIEQITEGVGENLLGEFTNVVVGANKVIEKNIKEIIGALTLASKAFVGAFSFIAKAALQLIDVLSSVSTKVFQFSDFVKSELSGFFEIDAVANPDDRFIFKSLSEDVKELARGYKDLSVIKNATLRKSAEAYRADFRAFQIYEKRKDILSQEGEERRNKIQFDRDGVQKALLDLQKLIDGEEVKFDIEPKDVKPAVKKVINEAREIAEKNPMPLEVKGNDIEYKTFFKQISDEARFTIENNVEKLQKNLTSLKPTKDSDFIDTFFNVSKLEKAKKTATELINQVKNAKGPDGKPLFSPDQAKEFAKIIKEGTKEAADSLKDSAEAMKEAFATTGDILSGIASGAEATQDPNDAYRKSLEESAKRMQELREELSKTTDAEQLDKIQKEILSVNKKQLIEASKARAEAEERNREVAKQSAGQAVSSVGAGIADALLPGTGIGQVIGPLLDVMQQSPEELRIFLDEFINSFVLIVEKIAENADVIILALVDALITKGGIVRIAAALIKAMVSLAGQFAMAVVAGITNGLGQFMDAFLNKFLVGVGEFLRSFVSALVSLPGQILSSIASAFEPILNFFRSWNPFSDEGGGNALYGRDSVAAKGQRFIEDLLFNQGGVVTANTGMIVPGTGSQDSVRALLTPGELVVPVPAVNNFRGFVGEEVDRRIAGLSGGSSDGQPVLVQVIMNEEVLAEQMTRINQDNQRVA